MTDISIVIVSWNVRDLLRRCLQTVHRARAELDLQVIVVDNASSDGSTTMVRTEFPAARLIVNGHNRGFPAANNQGIEAADGRYVLLLNPDTELLDGALVTMVEFADQHVDVGMIGPQMLNPDGSVQSSRRRFPTLATAFFESTCLQPAILDLHSRPVMGPLTRPIHRLLEKYYVADRPDDVVQDVDWITGSAMLARRAAIDDVGPMDERFFMYSEELDWCRRFRRAGWRVVYVPTAKIVHHAGKSSEQAVAARHIHFQTSKVSYFGKYHGPVAAGVLRWYLLLDTACRLGTEAAKWILGHKRPLRAQRISAYRQVLASGLRARTELP